MQPGRQMDENPVIEDGRADGGPSARNRDHAVGNCLSDFAHELGNVAFPLRMIVELQMRGEVVSGDELRDVLENLFVHRAYRADGDAACQSEL